MKVYTVVTEGMVVELDGKYWGSQSRTSNELDFGPIEKATILLSETYYKKPTDVAYGNADHVEKLLKARFVQLKKITTFEIGIDPGLVVMR